MKKETEDKGQRVSHCCYGSGETDLIGIYRFLRPTDLLFCAR